jgi:hypothetical protein
VGILMSPHGHKQLQINTRLFLGTFCFNGIFYACRIKFVDRNLHLYANRPAGMDSIKQFILEICALRQSFFQKFTLIWHHAFASCAQLIAFSPIFRCALSFLPCTQLLWNPPLNYHNSLLKLWNKRC